MPLYRFALTLHILGGTLALLSFWLPLVARKGGLLHRRAGWVYVAAMALLAVTGMYISGWRALWGTPAQRPFNLFLVFVGLLSASGATMGLRVLRAKQRTAAHHHPLDLGLSGLLLLAALALAGYGLWVGQPLLVAFAPVGVFAGASQLYYWLRPPTSRMHWWFEHMGSMGGSTIAVVTAFLVINAPRLGLPPTALAIWLTPALVGVAGLRLWARVYRRRFAGTAAIRLKV
jgi:uncharacterized membrane protein